MKLPIRWKFLIVFLIIALTPLLIVSVLDIRSLHKLGNTISDQSKDALLESVHQRLNQWIGEKASWLRERRALIFQLVNRQAEEVEKVWEENASDPMVHFYMEENFNRKAALPPGTELSPKHRVFDREHGTNFMMKVSYEVQSFYLAPGVTRKTVDPDILVLSRMDEVYAFLNRLASNIIFWQYTALESGLTSSYPGHGGMPAGFDPRKREWYQKAKESKELCWVGPYLDASSEELILSVVRPVYRSGSRFAGVTGIDLKISEMANQLRLPAGWPSSSLAMLVGREKSGQTTKLKVLARPEYQVNQEKWNSIFVGEFLDSSDQDQFGELVQDVAEGRSGIRSLPYEGKNCLWGYGSVGEAGLTLLAILPYDEVIENVTALKKASLHEIQLQVGRTTAFLLVLILVLIGMALFAARTVTRPIRELAQATREVSKGNLGTRVNIRTHDEIAELGEAFNNMVPHLEDRLQIKQSLALAREVQQNLLPMTPPHAPSFDFAGFSIYCDETGGDYYDFLEFKRDDKDYIGLVIGDVTGHGMAPAMLMVTARSLLKIYTQNMSSIKDIMESVNQQLTRDLSKGRFMTLFYLEIDLVQNRIQWASAGHDPAFYFRLDQNSFEDLDGGEIPLGINEKQTYSALGPRMLVRGDIIVMGTDGVWESKNENEERFGKDQVREVIRKNKDRSALEIAHAIRGEIFSFRGKHPQEDDISLVVAKYI